MSTQLLIFHDDPPASRANRLLAEYAGGLNGVEATHLGTLYDAPDEIDVDAESARLLAADRLILQFPIQWYSTPVLMKAWQDRVLTRLYYVDPGQGARLKGLPVIVCATAGNLESAYHHDGANGFPLEELLVPLQATARRCGWVWSDPHLVYRSNKMTEPEMVEAAVTYARHIEAWNAAPLHEAGKVAVVS